MLAGCALLPGDGTAGDGTAPGAGPSGRTAPASPPAYDPGTIYLAVVGDSITSPWGHLGDREFDETMWLSHVAQPPIVWAGGWAFPGATTADMAANVQPVSDAHVVVILAGTNDGTTTPAAETADNLRDVVGTVGADRVIVSSVPPRTSLPAASTELNGRLASLARQEGWEFVDASAGLRDRDRWVEGMTDDGVHPTPKGQAVLGAAIREAVLRTRADRD
jgi:lysophospholipase L1-like esterase